MSRHLMTLVVLVFQGGPPLQGDRFQEHLELLWDLVTQEVRGHLDREETESTACFTASCYLLVQQVTTTESHRL